MTAPGVLRDPLRAVLVCGIAVSVAVHARMAVDGGHGPGWSLAMAGMAVLCLSCGLALVRPGDRAGVVRMTMGMALAMALIHVLLLPLMGGSSTGAHAHHGGVPAVAAPSAGHGTMLLAVVVELGVGVLALAWTRRHGRAVRVGPTRPRLSS